MAYSLALTAEAENAPPAISHADPKTHTPLLRVKERGSRFYSPWLGRWVNRDRIGENGGLNVYGFLHNQSPNVIDSVGNVMTDFRPDPVDGCRYSLSGIVCGQTGCGHSDESGRIIGYREIVCTCSCDEKGDKDDKYRWHVRCNIYVWCEIELDARFRTSRTVLCGGDFRRGIGSESATRARVYGHEQRHAKAWIGAVKRDVVPILAEYEVGDGSKELCKLRAGFAMERGNEKMNEIMAKYHSNDTLNPLPDAPDAAYLYDPIGTMPQRADNE